MNLAPILLFVYNRPWHTKQCLEALSENLLADKSLLYIYADGLIEKASKEQQQAVLETRKIIKERNWCNQVIIIEREKNLGLANNVTDGITTVINKHGNIIVLEDDLVTSPYFLEFCNKGLDLYKDEKNVFSINAFQFPIGVSDFDTFLSPLATSTWGWATWKDRWCFFKKEMEQQKVISQNRHLRNRFNLADYDYISMMNNKNSWGIKWYYSAFIKNALGVFPTRSLIKNVGFDNSGAHSKKVNFQQSIYKKKPIVIKKNTVNYFFYSRVLDFFSKKKEHNIKKNIKVKKKGTLQGLIKRALKKIIRVLGAL